MVDFAARPELTRAVWGYTWTDATPGDPATGGKKVSAEVPSGLSLPELGQELQIVQEFGEKKYVRGDW